MRKLKTLIILASTSPRRIELLKQIGYKFRVVSPKTDETPRRAELPQNLVKRLAQGKAKSAKAALRSPFAPFIVIAADTIVVSPDGRRILNKPRNHGEAKRMLSMLQGKTHTVLTGFCVLSSSHKSITRVVKSKVTMRSLKKKAIMNYIHTGEPMDKAGAYAAQGRGMVLIEKISGSYTNVVGFPISQLVDVLHKKFKIPMPWEK